MYFATIIFANALLNVFSSNVLII